jgi:hypothetical protein
MTIVKCEPLKQLDKTTAPIISLSPKRSHWRNLSTSWICRSLQSRAGLNVDGD